MTRLLQILPEQKETDPDCVTTATQNLPPLKTGSSEAIAYCTELSKRLLADTEARKYPELQALGFWLRPTSIETMVARFLTENSKPAGTVFLMPPSNVATLFGYTCAIALLCGNIVIVRLPSAENPGQTILIELIKQCLTIALRARLIILRYGHDDVVTAKLSSVSNVRFIWGSDQTVDHIAAVLLPANARHVSFGDRFSSATISAEKYLALDATGRDKIVSNTFNDIYVFDQLACSSPRLLVWIGSTDAADKAATDFYPRLATHASMRGYQPGAGESCAKLNASFLALYDLAPIFYKAYSPALSVITLRDLNHISAFKTVNCGYGMLLAVQLETLSELAKHAERRDQTLTYACIDKEEAENFLSQCAGRGFTRIAPAGQALTFDPIWDGCNMFEAMCKPPKA